MNRDSCGQPEPSPVTSDELRLLTEIVSTIAEEEDPADSNIEEWGCSYCGESPSFLGGYADDAYLNPSNHPERCLWRKATEWRSRFSPTDQQSRASGAIS